MEDGSATPRTDSILEAVSLKGFTKTMEMLRKELGDMERELAAERKRADKIVSETAKIADDNIRLQALVGGEKQRADAAEADAKRYAELWRSKEVTIITSYFGNGCVNKTRTDVERVIDEAMK